MHFFYKLDLVWIRNWRRCCCICRPTSEQIEKLSSYKCSDDSAMNDTIYNPSKLHHACTRAQRNNCKNTITMFIMLSSLAKPLQEFTRVTWMNVGRRQVIAKLQTWPSSLPANCYWLDVHPLPFVSLSCLRLILILPSQGRWKVGVGLSDKQGVICLKLRIDMTS